MAPNTQPGQSSAPEQSSTGGEVNGRPSEVDELLGKVAKLLQDGEPRRALEVIARAGLYSPWATNAAGVCRLRLGGRRAAVEVFRGLALAGSLALRPEAPTVFKTNYATALLLANNVSGCLSVLDELRDEQHPAVRKLRAAVQRWRSGLSLWQKISWYLGGEPGGPVQLDFPPGDL